MPVNPVMVADPPLKLEKGTWQVPMPRVMVLAAELTLNAAAPGVERAPVKVPLRVTVVRSVQIVAPVVAQSMLVEL